MDDNAVVLPAHLTHAVATLYNAGLWADLSTVADIVKQQYPDHKLGWQASGIALFQIGNMAGAAEALSHAVGLAPDDAAGYNDLAAALSALGRVDDAIDTYRQAIACNPLAPEAHTNLGGLLCSLGRYEEAVESCRRAIAAQPASPVAHNNLGNALRELGRLDEAETAYRQTLVLMPGSLEARINLGTVLRKLGRLPDAMEAYRAAVTLHPNAGLAQNALGLLLAGLGVHDQEAMDCLHRAIALNAADANTYIALGNSLVRSGRAGEAMAMFRRAKELQPVLTWRANQAKADFSALFLDSPMAGSTPVDYLAARAPYDRHLYCVIPDTPADIAMLRDKADVVFNMICNADDGREMLKHALDLVERLDRPTINHPRLIVQTDRAAMAVRLGGIPGCVVPRTLRVTGADLARAAGQGAFPGFGLPGLVRVAGTHGGDDFDRFESWDEVGAFVAKAPDADYYLIDYVDYRSADGFFRKYRFIFVDGAVLPYHLAIHDDWKVHHFRTDMLRRAWMREEEARFLNDVGGVFGPAQQAALRAIGEATGLDYGGVDCGLDGQGRVVVFEANASMLVHDETDPLFAYKNAAVGRIKAAFDHMLSRRRVSLTATGTAPSR